MATGTLPLKRCSTSLIIREIQIKTTVSYHFIPVRMAVIKKDNIQELRKIWRNGNSSALLLGI